MTYTQQTYQNVSKRSSIQILSTHPNQTHRQHRLPIHFIHEHQKEASSSSESRQSSHISTENW